MGSTIGERVYRGIAWSLQVCKVAVLVCKNINHKRFASFLGRRLFWLMFLQTEKFGGVHVAPVVLTWLDGERPLSYLRVRWGGNKILWCLF